MNQAKSEKGDRTGNNFQGVADDQNVGPYLVVEINPQPAATEENKAEQVGVGLPGAIRVEEGDDDGDKAEWAFEREEAHKYQQSDEEEEDGGGYGTAFTLNQVDGQQTGDGHQRYSGRRGGIEQGVMEAIKDTGHDL